MATSVDLFIKFAVTLVNFIVAVDPALKTNPIVAEILSLIAALHLSATKAPSAQDT